VTEIPSIIECPLLLIYSSSRVLLQIYDDLLAKFDLTYTQYLVLVCIREKRRCSICEVGERLSLDSGTLSPLMKKLEIRGLVKRSRSFADERRLELCLTLQGSELLAKTHPVQTAVMEELPLGNHEVITLRKVLESLQDYKKLKLKTKSKNRTRFNGIT